MAQDHFAQLSRRERQILNIVYRKEQATAAEVLATMPDPPSYSAVRSLIRILESKGHLKHKKKGRQHVYGPTRPRKIAQRHALMAVLKNFFGGSREQVVAALLEVSEVGEDEMTRLKQLIENAQRKGN